MVHISCQNGILYREWSMQHRHREYPIKDITYKGYSQPLGQDEADPFWSSPAQFLALVNAWLFLALNSPQFLLSLFVPALLTITWNSRGVSSLTPPSHSLWFCRAVTQLGAQPQCDTFCSTHKREPRAINEPNCNNSNHFISLCWDRYSLYYIFTY